MKLRAWSPLALILLLASCSQGTQGIFASIEREQKVKSAGGLSETATVTHMTEFQGSYYIAGGGALFKRTFDKVKWHPTSPDAADGYKQVVAVGRTGTANGGILYAIANLDATDTNQLFSNDGTGWTKETIPGGDRAATLVPIRSNDGVTSDRLLVTVVNSGNEYSTVYVVTGDWSTRKAVTLGTPTYPYAFPITGAATDSSGDYYFANYDTVFYNTQAGATASPVTGVTGHGFYDVLILPSAGPPANPANLAGLAIISSEGAMFWGNLTAGAWTVTGQKANVKDSVNDQVLFGSMIYQTQNTAKVVWIGTRNGVINEGAGFASLEDNGSGVHFEIQPPSGTDSDNYRSTVLETSQVWCLYAVDAANPTDAGRYFLGSGAHGLWKWKPETKTWSQE